MGQKARRIASAVETGATVLPPVWDRNPCSRYLTDAKDPLIIIRQRERSRLEVYTLMSGLSYKVSRNGHAGDWYWEVISEREVIARGLAATSAQATAEALGVVGSSYIERQSDDSAPPSVRAISLS
jgi:hypothetical protein